MRTKILSGPGARASRVDAIKKEKMVSEGNMFLSRSEKFVRKTITQERASENISVLYGGENCRVMLLKLHGVGG